MVVSALMSFSKTIICLEDKTRSFRKECYLIHSVSAISVPIALGIFNSTRVEEDEKLERIMSA